MMNLAAGETYLWLTPFNQCLEVKGPATIYTERGTGRLHRLDGPAVMYSDGRTRWYRHGYPLGSIRRSWRPVGH